MTSRVVIEADGGSRGNPGPASYGALVRDADTGRVIVERGETIGVATNNVAEYAGLIAGLELYAEHADGHHLPVEQTGVGGAGLVGGRLLPLHPCLGQAVDGGLVDADRRLERGLVDGVPGLEPVVVERVDLDDLELGGVAHRVRTTRPSSQTGPSDS